jgi:hypothetical protein
MIETRNLEQHIEALKFAKWAACRGKPTSWWFPPKDEAMSREERVAVMANQRAAVRICEECPVQMKCLEFAIKWNERGIWGGVGEKQRIRLRSSNRKR